MIVVCAADKCAGALICDILNGTQSPIVDSIIHNKWNHLLKRPIIEQWHSPDDNTEWVKLPKNEKEWLQVSEKYLNMNTKDVAFGQHNPAYLIPNLDKFETVYNITTTTTQSRWLRFLRNYYLKIIGDGFLKHMIRYLMGALQALLKGRITINDIARYLQQHQQEKLSAKAKSKGLHLIRIEET